MDKRISRVRSLEGVMGGHMDPTPAPTPVSSVRIILCSTLTGVVYIIKWFRCYSADCFGHITFNIICH